jgi:hypothetical protein
VRASFQDDICLTSKLTVNAGLRYELVTTQWELHNLLVYYDPASQSLMTAKGSSLYDRALVNMPKAEIGALILSAGDQEITASRILIYIQFLAKGSVRFSVFFHRVRTHLSAKRGCLESLSAANLRHQLNIMLAINM